MALGIYKNVEVLNKDTHKSLKIDELKGFDYAKELRDCVISLSEFYQSAKSQPIVFSKNDQGEYFAVALMGLKEQKNLFVQEDGSWKPGEYVPAFIRRYPFVFVSSGEQLVLAVDTDCPAVNEDQGQMLFDEEGEVTAYTEKVMEFMLEYQQSNAQTQVFIQTLDELDLLETASAELNQEGEKLTFTGFSRINEKKFNDLNDEDTLKLVRSGYYKLVTAHLMSLTNFSKLMSL